MGNILEISGIWQRNKLFTSFHTFQLCWVLPSPLILSLCSLLGTCIQFLLFQEGQRPATHFSTGWKTGPSAGSPCDQSPCDALDAFQGFFCLPRCRISHLRQEGSCLPARFLLRRFNPIWPALRYPSRGRGIEQGNQVLHHNGHWFWSESRQQLLYRFLAAFPRFRFQIFSLAFQCNMFFCWDIPGELCCPQSQPWNKPSGFIKFWLVFHIIKKMLVHKEGSAQVVGQHPVDVQNAPSLCTSIQSLREPKSCSSLSTTSGTLRQGLEIFFEICSHSHFNVHNSRNAGLKDLHYISLGADRPQQILVNEG